MIKLRFKNLIRLIVAVGTMPVVLFRKQSNIYLNLISRSEVGGPSRFLSNLSNYTDTEYTVSNWLLAKCRSALIFSASWGDSFSILCRILGIRTVLRVDGFYVPEDIVDESYRHDKTYLDFVNQRLKRDLSLFDHVIYQSRFAKEICDEYLVERKENYSIVYNGTNLDHFYPGKSSPQGIVTILLSAKHYPKHLDLFIETLKNLPSDFDYRVKVVGPMRDGTDEVLNYLNGKVAFQEFSKRIEVLGVLSFANLPKAMRECDIFLHVKVGDWCPNAVVEALACGLPVVTPEFGGTSELIGNAGVSIKGERWKSSDQMASNMASAIVHISDNLEHFQCLARERAEKMFDIKEVSKLYDQAMMTDL